MRGYQEIEGHNIRLDYDRDRGFVARPAPHPFVFRNVASEVRTEAKKPGNFDIAASSWSPSRADNSSNSSHQIVSLPPPMVQQERGEPLTRYEDNVWSRAVVGLALAGIVVWVGLVVS
jgi:hypothetical protein